MASSPSSISGRRSRPGCMGTIAHLFDFNQALAGRKLLTEKKYGAGLGPLRNSSSDLAEPLNLISSEKETQLGKSASVSRRLSKVPIKALIAEDISEELSKDFEPKNRAPSVVARLMGLDDLPRDSQSIHLRGSECYVEKVQSNRLHHGRGSAENTPSASMELGGSPVRSESADRSISKRSGLEEFTSSFGDSSVQGWSQKSSSTEEYGLWKSSMSKDNTHIQALDDMDLQLAAKQMLIKKKLTEAKLGLLSTHSGLKEKLYESKEFMDAIDFLQANKDFFVRFLEEPDSLFTKHVRNKEKSRPSIEHARGHPHGGWSQSRTKEPPDWKKNQHRSIGTKLLVDGSVSFVAHQQKLVEGMEYNVSKIKEHHQAPTRIVVLKPGPCKARKLMSLSQSSPRSPREFFDAMDVIKESSMDVLQELREKLKREDGRGKMRHTALPAVNEPAKALKDPRDIAREIARQVRENVTRDLRVRAQSTMLPPHGSPVNRGRGEKGAEPGGMPITIIASTKGGHEESDTGYIDKSSSTSYCHVLDENASYGVKDEPRRSLDQPSIIAVHVDGYGESSEYYPLQTVFSEDSRENAMRKKLPRSRSMPTSSSSFHASQTEVLKEDRRVPVSDIFVADGIDQRRSSNGIPVQSDPLRRSIFRRRGSGSKGSISRSKKQIKEADASPFLSQETSLEKSTTDAGIGSEKVQHQIDDLGPIPESDSSVPSLDNFSPSEVTAIAADDVDGDTPCVQVLEDFEVLVHSPLVSPSKVASFENDGTMSITSEASKSPFEQPSPVSVLDAPFHEEPESPMDFSEISSGLQELRMRLQLLKFGDQVEKVSNQEDYQEGGVDFTDDSPCAINVNISDMAMEDPEFYCKHMTTPSSVVDGIVCPEGKEPELKYVSTLLVAAGFTGDHDTILTHWHAPNQPLAPFLLQKLEEEDKVGGLSPPTRRLLFENVNEVLLGILGPLVNCRMSWKVLYGLAAACVMPSGKDLVQKVWAGVCRFSQGVGQDTLENLVVKDLSEKDQWCDLGTEVEAVVLEVERTIYGVLIEEILTF